MAENGGGETGRVEQQPPYVLAMIICDSVYIDPTTSKRSLLGIFSDIIAPSFPVNIAHFMLYAVFTDGHGTTPIKIRLVDANELRDPIVDQDSEVIFHDPRMMADLIFGMVGLGFPEPGEYRLQLLCCGTLLMERRIVCSLPPETPHAQDG
jgi:hypothetical protein